MKWNKFMIKLYTPGQLKEKKLNILERDSMTLNL